MGKNFHVCVHENISILIKTHYRNRYRRKCYSYLNKSENFLVLFLAARCIYKPFYMEIILISCILWVWSHENVFPPAFHYSEVGLYSIAGSTVGSPSWAAVPKIMLHSKQVRRSHNAKTG